MFTLCSRDHFAFRFRPYKGDCCACAAIFYPVTTNCGTWACGLTGGGNGRSALDATNLVPVYPIMIGTTSRLEWRNTAPRYVGQSLLCTLVDQNLTSYEDTGISRSNIVRTGTNRVKSTIYEVSSLLLSVQLNCASSELDFNQSRITRMRGDLAFARKLLQRDAVQVGLVKTM